MVGMRRREALREPCNWRDDKAAVHAFTVISWDEEREMESGPHLRQSLLSLPAALVAAAVACLAFSDLALAQDAAPACSAKVLEKSAPNSGDTAWMLASVALVLMMTIPGLGLFYGGM